MADDFVVPITFSTDGAESAFGTAQSAAERMGQSVADATAKGQAGLKDVEDGAKSAGEHISQVDEVAKRLLETLGAYEGLRFLEEAVSKAEDYQATLRQIEASITATGGAAHVSAGQMQEIADQIEATTNFSHEAALQAENLLTNFRAIKGEDTFERVTQDVADLAAKMGRDLPQAAIQLGRVIETGTVTQLQRIGVVFSDTEKASIKSMHAMGDEAGVLEVVLGGVEAVLNGQAAAQRGAGESAEALKNDLAAFMEVLGGTMIPAVREVSGGIADWLKQNEGLAASLGGELGTAIKTVGELVLWMAQNWDTLSVAVGAFVGYKVAGMVLSLAEAISGLLGIETAASVKAAELAAAQAAEAAASAASAAALVELVPALTLAAGAMERAAAASLALTAGEGELAGAATSAGAATAAGAVIYDAYGAAVSSSAVASGDAAAAATLHAGAVAADAAATEGAAAATDAFTASLLANPVTLALVAVGGLAVAMHNYVLEVDAAAAAQDREFASAAKISDFLDQFGTALERLHGDFTNIDDWSKQQREAARQLAEADLKTALAAETAAVVRIEAVKKQIVAIEAQIEEEKKLAIAMASAMGDGGGGAIAQPSAGGASGSLVKLRDELAKLQAQQQLTTKQSYDLMAVLDLLGEGDALYGAGVAKATKEQANFTDSINKVIVGMQERAAKLAIEADAELLGTGAARLHAGAMQAEAEIAKLETEAKDKGLVVTKAEEVALRAAGAAIDQNTASKLRNALTYKEGEAEIAAAALGQAKLADATSQSTSAGIIAAAVEKERVALAAAGIPILSEEGQRELERARNAALASIAIGSQVAQIGYNIKATDEQRAAEAALADALSRSNDYSRANAIVTAADTQAKRENLSGGFLDARRLEISLLGFQLQGTKDLTAGEQGLAAVREGALQGAESEVAKLEADLGLYAQINPAVGGLAQQYQSLFTAEGFVAYQELLLQEIHRNSINLATQEGQVKAQLLAADLAGVSRQIEAYRQLSAVLQQRAADEKSVADAVSKDWETLFQAVGESAAGMAVTWKSIWQGMEKTVVDALANMAAHEAESSIVQGLFGQGATLQTALFGGGPGGGATAQFQSAVSQFGTFVGALTGSSPLGGLGGILGGAGDKLASAGSMLGNSASLQTDFSKQEFQWFGENSGLFTNNAQEFDLAAALQTEAAASTAAAGASSSGGGLISGIASLFGGGGSGGLASGVGASGLLYAGAVAFAGWVVYNVITGFLSKAGPDPNTTFGPGMTFGGVQPGASYNQVGGTPSVGLGAAGASLTSFDQQSQQVVQSLQQFFEGFEKATGQIIQSLPAIAVQVSKNGLEFQVTVGNTIIGSFQSMQSAIDHGIAAAFNKANLGNLPKIIQDYVKNLSGSVDPTQILGNVQVLQQVIAGAHGAISQITTDMANFGNQVISENIALVNMGLSLADLGTMLGDVNSGIVALDEKERDSIEGKRLTAKQQQQLDMETYNNALALQEASVKQQIIQLQVEALSIAGQGAYITGLGLVARATVDSATIQAKSAGVIDDANKLLLDSINAAIQSDEDLLKQLAGLTIKPGDLHAPGGSASSSVTSLASAAQTLAQALLALTQFGMLPFDAAVLKINRDIDEQEKGLKKSSQAYKDEEAARAADIALLRLQTQAQTDAVVTPLVQQAHGLSTFAVGLSAIHTQFANIYKTEQDLGAGSAELHRVRVAELQDEKNLVMQVVGGLSLPLDTTAADAKKFSDAIEALRTGLADSAISAAEFNREMQQIAQQGSADVLTMVEGIYTAAGNTKQAELVKEQLEQIDFEIKLAQLQEETDILLAQGVITQALADQVSGIEAFFADPANTPDWAKLNAGASSATAAQGNLASSAQSAADALQKFIDSLRQNTAISPLTPAERVTAAAAEWQRDLGLANAPGADATAVSNAQQAATDYLTALRDEYGSSGPYTLMFNAVLTQLQALEQKLGLPVTTPSYWSGGALPSGLPAGFYPGTGSGAPGGAIAPPPSPTGATVNDPGTTAARAAADALNATAVAGTAAAAALRLIATGTGGQNPADRYAARDAATAPLSPWGAVPPLSPAAVVSVRLVPAPPQGDQLTADGKAVVAELAAFRDQQRAEAAVLAGRVAEVERRQAELTRAMAVVGSVQRAGRAA